MSFAVILGLSIFLSVPYGILSRMCGGGFVKLPYGLDQWLYAFPFAILGYLSIGWWGVLLAGIFAFLGKRTGHGQYMDLGSWTGIVKPERLDLIVKWFFGKDPNKTHQGAGSKVRDFFGLCVTGAFTALGASIALALGGHLWLSLIVFLGGAAKGVAYLVGWDAWWPEMGHNLDEPTEVGEFFCGFFAGVPLFFSILWLLL